MYSRKFTLRHSFAKLPKSEKQHAPTKVHFGIPWSICVHWNDDNLGVFLSCGKPKDEQNPWGVRVDFTCRIGKEKATIEKSCGAYYEYDCYDGIDGFCKWNDTMSGNYMENDKLTVEIDVIIKEINGLGSKRKLYFNEPEEHITDVVLAVADQKFHISKKILASFSEFFKSLFFKGYTEAKHQEIDLKEVDPNAFQLLLEIVHGESECIQEDTIEDILSVATQLDVKMVTKKCVEFMINNTGVDLDKQFRLASQFHLVDLQDNLLEGIKSKKDSENRLNKSIDDMSDSFIAKMIRKVHK